MQEIAPHVYYETSYPGVTLGAMAWPHGLILIDSPFRLEDNRSWRSALMNLGGGVDRMLINLDAHFDRTLGTRAMDCTVVGHEKMAQVFRNRPMTFKVQGAESGAEWEQFNGLGSIRWAPPEITFTDTLSIDWDGSPLVLRHRPGPAIGAIWAELPGHGVAFIGDAVTPHQPPFLSSADLPAWIETLQDLLAGDLKNALLIGGRCGLVGMDEVRAQIEILRQIHDRMEELNNRKGSVEETEKWIQPLLGTLKAPAERAGMYAQRLRKGLHQYYTRHYQLVADDVED